MAQRAWQGKLPSLLLSVNQGQHLWARGYFVCSSGNVTDEMIAEYIRNQDAEPQDDERFKISE
jgi:REP element-mobilizing transposase RayT